jgi:GH24 family phage-related lysozyme (muramidase)
MNLIGESFDPFVNKQIDIRQKKLGESFRDNNNLVWQNSKTGFIKLTSCVDIQPNQNGELPSNLLKYTWLNNPSLQGSVLAKTFVLDTGLTNTNTNPNRIFQGITRDTSIINNYAYGLGGTEFGINPIPGVENLLVKHKNEGSLREAQINIKANNRFQFEILDILFLRLGYSVLIEWGNTLFYDNNENFTQFNQTLQNYIFTPGHNHLDVHREILRYREKNSANYDGMIGRVKNFTWTVTKDGVYNIILNVISYGDLIDSLRVNNIYGINQKQDVLDNLNDEDIFTKSKSKHSIGRHFYQIKSNSKNTLTKDQTIYKLSFNQFSKLGLPYTPDPKITHIAIIQPNDGAIEPQYYYRLGSFLEFLQYNSQIFNNIPGTFRGNSNPAKAPYFDFDFDTNTNFLYQDAYQFSSDPRICIYQKQEKVLGNSFIDLYKGLEPSRIAATSDIPNVIALMNIYINFEFILNKLDELLDDKGKVNLTDFLKAICDGINESCGYYNQLTPFIDTDNNIVRLIEKRTFPGYEKLIANVTQRPVKNTILKIFGVESDVEGSFVRDFTFQTNLTNEFSSIVAIGAQAAGGNISEDSTLLSKLNQGLIDRIFPQKLSGDNLDPQTVEEINARLQRERAVLQATGNSVAGPEAFTYDPLKAQLRTLTEKYAPYVNDYIKNVNTVYSPKTGAGNLTVPLWNPEVFDTQKDLIKNLVQYNNLYYATQKALPSVSVGNFALPLNLKLTLDGISGMKILQQFLVNSKFLPAGYDDNLIYLIINLSHKVDNNTWITELDTIFVPKNPEVAPAEVQPFNDFDNPITQNIATSEFVATDNIRRPFYQYTPSDNAINLIAQFEGFRNKAYQDEKGIWTIGYGSTRIRSLGSVRGTFTAPPRPVRQGDEFDTEFLTELFKLDLQDFTRSLNRNLRNLQVTQSEYDALVSFSYNTGTAWASLENGGSNLRTQLFRANAGQISYSEASDALLEWNKVKKKNKKTGQTVVTISNGLTRRRRAEQLLFNYKAP